MKTVLLAVLLLAGAGRAARAQTYYPDLTSQTLNVPGRAVWVEQVVDGRVGNPPIGIAYRAGKSAAIEFRQGVGPELTTFLLSQLPRQPFDHPVVLCLRRLQLSETLGGTQEQATAELAADVYEHLPDGYHFVQAVAAQASNTGREVTYRHAEHVTQMLGHCLGQLTGTAWPTVAARPARTLTELPADQPAALVGRRAVPAVLREPLRRGLYLRFDQFLANRPDTALAFSLDTLRRHYRSRLATVQWLGVARVRPKGRLGIDHNVPLPELWGFCDGQQAFVKYGKEYFPLMRQGNSFTFVGETPLDQVHEAALAQAQGRTSMIAGVAGAVLARTNVPDHTGEPLAYGLDMSTGATSPYPSLRTPLRSDTAFVYIYRPAHSAGAEAVKVLVNGQEVGALLAGQYLELPWARFGKPM
ncbi:hypothetical protein [Hymenobacter armeniacus]|uniref:Uncharacterized protein n=1 Tax=Hymenobacter armeniacus TaxID=2771358 RepID=A0ABR8K0X6_9BACT|nr:hypothetical protein [Hymenobacter armeniacus]MBD2723879.1 hypothetical protein [Hymenobacter armeniacus]